MWYAHASSLWQLIERLERRLEERGSEVERQESTVRRLQTRMEQYKGRVSRHSGESSVLKERVDELEKRAAELGGQLTEVGGLSVSQLEDMLVSGRDLPRQVRRQKGRLAVNVLAVSATGKQKPSRTPKANTEEIEHALRQKEVAGGARAPVYEMNDAWLTHLLPNMAGGGGARARQGRLRAHAWGAG